MIISKNGLDVSLHPSVFLIPDYRQIFIQKFSRLIREIKNENGKRSDEAVFVLAMMSAMKSMRVLLADDDADDRDLFKEAVATVNSEIQVQTVQDGTELMSLLTKDGFQLPDIIFLDLNMPRKGGKECLNEIRSHEKLKNVPVIIYSTSATVNDIDDTYRIGANLYIQKPNSFSALTKLTNKVFSINWNDHKPHSEKNKFLLSETK